MNPLLRISKEADALGRQIGEQIDLWHSERVQNCETHSRGFQKKPTHWDVRLESKLICGIRSVCKIVKLTLEVCLYFQ
uniref:Syntaxin-6_N domain-containing protein n=1 Tax=Ascaris lumbricoides TaxID=6252 RepID=A0A0M3INP2_ASCLU